MCFLHNLSPDCTSDLTTSDEKLIANLCQLINFYNSSISHDYTQREKTLMMMGIQFLYVIQICCIAEPGIKKDIVFSFQISIYHSSNFRWIQYSRRQKEGCAVSLFPVLNDSQQLSKPRVQTKLTKVWKKKEYSWIWLIKRQKSHFQP